jgi:osmotically-inducible protein OsmY
MQNLSQAMSKTTSPNAPHGHMPRARRFAAARPLVLLVMLLALICCAPLAAQEKTAGDHVDDTWIHTKVKTALATNRGGSINIEVYKGEVQLAGFTNDPELQKSLPDHAARVSGVKRVFNQIIIAEPGRSVGERLDDGLLVTAVEGAMADNSLGKAFDINTEANRGNVLLSGFVDSDEDRQAVIEIVRRVDGVEKVIDGINIKNDE